MNGRVLGYIVGSSGESTLDTHLLNDFNDTHTQVPRFQGTERGIFCPLTFLTSFSNIPILIPVISTNAPTAKLS